ncbi:unnamed protein product [Rotaria sp. Silwood2]|nr:unnamed protein product [Rotaria sp. Silwood2]CAF4090472.1 unnamed protein product [Rotaria sp. Silwood2]
MKRARLAELRHHLDMVAKVALQPFVQSVHIHDDLLVFNDHYHHHNNHVRQRNLPILPYQISMSNNNDLLWSTYKVDYDHSLFESIDEIMMILQYNGEENLLVYKDNLKVEEEFIFNSRCYSD